MPVFDTWTPESLAAVAGALVSAAFLYFDPLRAKWDTLADDAKRRIMGLVILGIAVLVFALSCAAPAEFLATLPFPVVVCSQAGGGEFVTIVLGALLGNQGAFLILKRSPAPRPE